MRVLVLGGYGLIGLEIVRRLVVDGVEVVGLGRSVEAGRRAAPDMSWIGADIAKLVRAEDWRPHLANIDAVVNASGALQDGAKDNLAAVQDRAIRALVAACEADGVKRFIQISAPGAEPDADTAFLRTKAAADAALRASALDWTILKPGLVISANAYGGTALLRMLAAFPVVQPLVRADAPVQTVSARDVADAISFSLTSVETSRRSFDLVEREAHSLRDLVAAFRAWLGFPPASTVIALPSFLGGVIARGADLAGWLGWRSPLRTTALRVLADGVKGDGAAWEAVRGHPLASLRDTLAGIPATLQERTYARAALVFPVLVLTLAAFWLLSGLIGFWRAMAATCVLTGIADPRISLALVLGGAALDVTVGLGVLLRRFTRVAALASVAVSAVYLAAGTWLTPYLWADPLGPFVKVFPVMALGLAVAALAEKR